MTQRIIDAWIQHPTARMVDEPMFDSLRRWTKAAGMIGDIPIESTLGALDEAGVDRAMICAWSSPRGALITNDEVAAFVAGEQAAGESGDPLDLSGGRAAGRVVARSQRPGPYGPKVTVRPLEKLKPPPQGPWGSRNQPWKFQVETALI